MAFSVKDTSKVIKDRLQITSITLNGFYFLSKALLHHPHPLFLKDSIKLDGMRSKIKWKKRLFYIVFPVLKALLIKNYNLPLTVPLSLVVLLQLLHQQIYFLQHFRSLFIQHYLKKKFVTNFPFLSNSLKRNPNPWRPKSAESVMKTFCRCFLITIS